MNNVLITGVSGGIGKAVAEKLLTLGSVVIGLDRTIRDEVRTTAARYQGQLVLLECDLMDVAQLQDLVKNIVATHGPIGGFVHCAGFDKMAPLHLTKVEDIENLWRLHALVPMVMIAAISKKKNHTESANIILISSHC